MEIYDVCTVESKWGKNQSVLNDIIDALGSFPCTLMGNNKRALK
jgi:hypothetical protein